MVMQDRILNTDTPGLVFVPGGTDLVAQSTNAIVAEGIIGLPIGTGDRRTMGVNRGLIV